ncbi:DMT family transporter [Roseicyclus sp.]|uniref:DMT family transporter n=1 Tax=Roseicyclus sp. TaxID=1914329 RepID=UPI003F6C788E
MAVDKATQLRGVALALASFAIYATHDVLIKYLGGIYSPFQIVFFSVLFGFPMMVLFMMRDAQGVSLKPVHPGWTALRTSIIVVNAATAFYAFSVLPLAQTYAILFAAPLLITLLAIPMLGERVGLRRGAAVGVGLCGVLIVLQPGVTEFSLGHLAALVAAVCSAMNAVIMRKIGGAERAVVLLLYPMIANVVVMGAALPFVYRPMPGLDLLAAAIIAAFALFATWLLILAYRVAPAAKVAPMQYSQIIWATIFGALFFDEALEWSTAIGTAVIVASGIYIVFREDRGGRSATTPVLRSRGRAVPSPLPTSTPIAGPAAPPPDTSR